MYLYLSLFSESNWIIAIEIKYWRNGNWMIVYIIEIKLKWIEVEHGDI